MKPGSYTWIHHRPPPQRKETNIDMYDMLDMLSEVDLSSGEFYSIMRDSEFFDGMDQLEMMALSDSLASGSGPHFGPFESDDEGETLNLFRMAAMSEALDDFGPDDFGPDDFGPDDFDLDDLDELDPMEAALISMMMHSHIDEDSEDEY